MSDDLKLTDAFVAFAAAGLDNDFTLFKLYTRALQDKATGEHGQFHLDGKGSITDLEQSTDPVGKLKRMVRVYLFHAYQTTGVPVEKWIVEFSPVMERFNIPSHLFLDTGRDRAWLA